MRDSWTATTLGALVNIQKGKKPLLLGDNTTTGQPYLTADVLRGSAPSQFVLQSALAACVQLQGNETILLWDGAGAGDVFRSTTGVLASTMAKLAIKPTSLISEDYLYLVVMNTSPEIKSSCRGTTVPHVSPGALSAISLTLPPLSEQKRIVDVIAAVDTYIAALQQHVADAQTARNAVQHELLTAVGDDWTETTLGSHINVVMGQAPPGNDCNKNGVGVPFVKAGEFTDRFPVIREWTTNPLRYAKLGDTLICVVGATCGKLSQGIDCAIGRSVAALQPLETIDSQFLWNFMTMKVQEMRSGSRGSAQGVITKDDLADLKIMLPPLTEQQQIAEMVSTMDDVINAAHDAVSDAQGLRSGLLSELLSGDHEIPETYDRLLGAA